MAKKSSSRKSVVSESVPLDLIPDEEHPYYVPGMMSDGTGEFAELTPDPDGPFPLPFPPFPQPGPTLPPFPQPVPTLPPFPQPGPIPPTFPWPPPLNVCAPVSGTYRLAPIVAPPTPPTSLTPLPPPLHPFLTTITVRVDVDRYYPQNRISIEVSRIFPRSTTHAIAEVTSDRCLGFNNRRIEAVINYRDGDASLLPGETVVFEAKRSRAFTYDVYRLTVAGVGITPKTYNLVFHSRYFDSVEFEVDRVENAGNVFTSYPTGSHPNRPNNLPVETISLQTVYQRSGFDVTMSPGESVIPLAGAQANGTWSDSEMHNAMVTFWSRFSNLPRWAMWVLYAARHDEGRSLGGIMFDDIGPNHRQGTAIFTDSFIQDAPPGDPNAAAWRQRMMFWTAIHEMGHAFNLAHSWQKALGAPWIPLANENEARSFMNYPFRVAGGESSFFNNFAYRFSDDELVFMRHAPRRFVQMGNANWFDNHAFEEPGALMQPARWALKLRPNRDANTYRFLEPVNLELKLTNYTSVDLPIEEDMLTDGRHVMILVGREGSAVRQWRPFVTRCHKGKLDSLAPNQSIYGSHLISATTTGWLIDEPGFYRIQAAIEIGGEVVISNVVRLYVAPPTSAEEIKLAPDYFSEEVGRAIAFNGAPALPDAMNVLREVRERCADNPAALHATTALAAPKLRDYKVLDGNGERADLSVQAEAAQVEEAAKELSDALLKQPARAAETLGHIDYFATLGQLAEALENEGDAARSAEVLESSIQVMEEREILASVIRAAERKLSRVQRQTVEA